MNKEEKYFTKYSKHSIAAWVTVIQGIPNNIFFSAHDLIIIKNTESSRDYFLENRINFEIWLFKWNMPASSEKEQ